MVTRSGKDGLHVGTISGQSCLFRLNKSRGCLCVSLRKDLFKVFPYKEAVFLGLPIICAVMLINSAFEPVYLAISLVIILIFILYQLIFPVIEERILLVKGLGYQISTKMFTRNITTFIPYERVQRIFINEVILRHRIIYILSLIVQDDKNHHKLIPLFADTLPRLDCLELIYRSIKHFEDS